MAEALEHIPTLTNIVKAGDPAMLNHFDAHQFETPVKSESYNVIENSLEDELQNIIEVSDIIESTSVSATGDFDIPSIQFDSEEKNEIPDKIFSSNESLNDKANLSESSEKDDTKDKIDRVVQNFLPEIEKQLKKRLYQEFEI